MPIQPQANLRALIDPPQKKARSSLGTFLIKYVTSTFFHQLGTGTGRSLVHLDWFKVGHTSHDSWLIDILPFRAYLDRTIRPRSTRTRVIRILPMLGLKSFLDKGNVLYLVYSYIPKMQACRHLWFSLWVNLQPVQLMQTGRERRNMKAIELGFINISSWSKEKYLIRMFLSISQCSYEKRKITLLYKFQYKYFIYVW